MDIINVCLEMYPNHSDGWKESSYTRNNFDQEYYLERWESFYKNGLNRDGLVLVLRQQHQQGIVPGHKEVIVSLFLLWIILILSFHVF